MTIRIVLSVVWISLLADSELPTQVRQSGRSHAFSFDAAKNGREEVSVDPLSGIPAVFVSGTRLSPSTKEVGLSKSEVERLIEDDLARHHIPLRPENESQREKPPKYAMLSVAVRVVGKGDTVAYDVTLSLLETLLRQHDRDIVVHAPIWRCQELGIGKADQIKREIIQGIHSAVDDFSAAFAAAH